MKLIALMLILSLAQPSLAMSLQDLSKAELTAIKRGELLIKKKDKKGESWAELYGYAILETSPLEAVAIFAAYDHQQDYVPKMLKSLPIRQPKPTQVIVDYELRLPWPIPNSKYTHRISLSQPGQNHYRINWVSIQSNDTDAMNGESNFIKMGDETLWLYRSFVKPASFLAGLFEKSMVEDVTFSLEAIRKYTHFLKKKNPKLMNKYTGYISRSLAGEYVYKSNPPQ